MGLRFDPIGGGQFKQAVQQIIQAESQPVRQLEAHKQKEEARLKLFQEFKNKFAGVDKAIDEVSTFKKLSEFKVDLGDGANIASVTIDKDKVQPGSYAIQVDELAQRSSVISNGFTDPDEKNLGIGFVVMKGADGNKNEIYVDDDHASLRGVASLINAEPNSPIRASVVQDSSDDDAPWKLIMTAKKEGKVNQIDFPEFYFLDASKDFYVDSDHDAKNAQIKVDGFKIEQGSNDIPDFLPGVNLHLKQARPDQPFTLTISEDHQKVAGKVKELVSQLNSVLEFIVKQNSIDQNTDTSTTFAGDTGLQTIEYRLRNLMHEGFPVGKPGDDSFRLVFMNQIGVEFDKSGSLTFKEDKFQKALEKDFDGIAEAIAGPRGFAYQLREGMKGYTQAGNGMLALREQGIRSRIKGIDDQIDRKMQQLDRRQQSLTDQFARLEGSLANMQRQSQYLTASLPSGGGGNLVAQLLGG